MRNPTTVKMSCALVLLYAAPLFAQNQPELILDGYAYAINSNVVFNFTNETITIADSDAENCLQPGDFPPQSSFGNFLLQTNNQTIGISRTRYVTGGNLLYLTSETSNLLCDNGVFIDQIFLNGFE